MCLQNTHHADVYNPKALIKLCEVFKEPAVSFYPDSQFVLETSVFSSFYSVFVARLFSQMIVISRITAVYLKQVVTALSPLHAQNVISK